MNSLESLLISDKIAEFEKKLDQSSFENFTKGLFIAKIITHNKVKFLEILFKYCKFDPEEEPVCLFRGYDKTPYII